MPARVRDNRAPQLSYYQQTTSSHRRLIGIGLPLVALALPATAQRPVTSPIIDLVVAHSNAPPRQYRALRRLDAQSDRLGNSAWIEAWTDVAPGKGFTYKIVGEGGSGFVRGKVLRPWLDHEKKMWTAGDPERASLTHENYAFADKGLTPDGLAWLSVKSRRKDLLLVDGSIYVNAEDGDLVRIEGRLTKTPSFWTRRVEVVRHYQRINGVHVPVAIESIANVLIAGRSTFKMIYEYETINDQRVGTPQPRTSTP